MRGIKFAAREKLKIIEACQTSHDVFYMAKKNKCTERSIWRWKALVSDLSEDATVEEKLKRLQNKSSRPHTPHPNSHTEKERKQILQIVEELPNAGYSEWYGELRTRFAYSRHFRSMCNFIRKHCVKPAKIYEKYVPKEYITPEMFGVKWQMDVKFVPRFCYIGKALKNLEEVGERLFQYTMIDEATRERFIYAYNEHSGYSTKDFIKRAIVYFGYIPLCIQTDNGTEFTNPRGTGEGRKHVADITMERFGIEHKLIRPYTPRHNGKVERSHRNDQARFYNYSKFNSLEDLQNQMQQYLIRSNKIPTSVFKDKNGKLLWMSPLEKREDLIQELKELQTSYNIRFINSPRNKKVS